MSDIIYTPPASGGGGTTINPTNNFIPLRSNATTFVDSNIQNIKGSGYGVLNIDNNYQSGGGTSITLGNGLNDFNGFLYSYDPVNNPGIEDLQFGCNPSGFSLNYLLDYNTFSNSYGTLNFGNVALYGTFNLLKTTYQGADIGLNLDFGNYKYILGDYNSYNNGNYIYIDDDNSLITTNYAGNQIGLYLDFNGNAYALGDYNGIINNTSISVDDTNQIINIKTEGTLVFTGSTLESASSGGSSGKHLVITLNGNTYKIKLELP